MKKLLLFFLLTTTISFLGAQTYTRLPGESAEEFAGRIKPEERDFVHPVLEVAWDSDKKVIIAFWDIEINLGENYRGTYAEGRLLVPTGDNTYKSILIDTIPENPMPPEIRSVFFYDTDGDGSREMVVLYSNDYRHYQMAGTFFAARSYKNMDYNALPDRLYCIEDIDGGKTGNNDEGEESVAIFTNASEVKAYLKERGKPNWWDLNFEKTFTGTIGKDMEVSFTLQKRARDISGFYYYKKSSADIELIGYIENSNVQFSELDEERKTGAAILGKFAQDGFRGEWKGGNPEKTYPVVLTESPFLESPLPTDIEGVYKDESEYCPMQVEIKKEGVIYTYKMTTTKNEYKGQVAFHRPDKDDSSLYIEFPDIMWAEDRGNLGLAESEEDMPASSETWGVLGLWNGDQSIIIQNAGNSMNYYIKIGECDVKYIILEKQ